MSGKALFLLPLLLLLLCSFFIPTEKTSLVLNIENIEEAKGHVWIGVYDSQKNFLQKDAAMILIGEKIRQTGSIQVEVKDLSYGTYAVALFHDVNDNGTLDQGILGIPKEPYVFSKPLKSKWRAPTFEDVKFSFNSSTQDLQLGLEEWTW